MARTKRNRSRRNLSHKRSSRKKLLSRKYKGRGRRRQTRRGGNRKGGAYEVVDNPECEYGAAIKKNGKERCCNWRDRSIFGKCYWNDPLKTEGRAAFWWLPGMFNNKKS